MAGIIILIQSDSIGYLCGVFSLRVQVLVSFFPSEWTRPFHVGSSLLVRLALLTIVARVTVDATLIFSDFSFPWDIFLAPLPLGVVGLCLLSFE